MPQIRKWKSPTGVVYEVPYFDELTPSGNSDGKGMLPRDLEAHCLWQYFGIAVAQYQRAKSNIVEESELSEKFDATRARQLFDSLVKLHGLKHYEVVKYWGVIDRQRIALGMDDVLPREFQFRFWGH